ncbi:MAG: ArsR/SmtB family transcription factor [Opitutales bacterium]
MHVTELAKALADGQRVRVLNLLAEGPLCVCHLMAILDADQVKVSKQLGYLKRLGLVTASRNAQWMVYRLADPQDPLIRATVGCLREHPETADGLPLAEDLEERLRLLTELAEDDDAPADLARTLCC